MLLKLVAMAAALSLALAALPPPLHTVCVAGAPVGCFADAFARTFPVAVSEGCPTAAGCAGQPFSANMTLETCGYLCHKSTKPGAPFTAAAVEAGNQCFCANAAMLRRAAPNATKAGDCASLPPAGLGVPCLGNPLQLCGGAWRLLAYNFTCHPYVATSLPWQDHKLPAEARVDDLVGRLSAPQLVAQLLQNGADIYGKDFQLPRYIVTQECLAGFDGGNIFLAPAVNQTPSSAFPQPCNMGASWDTELVRELASAISDEARAAFNHAARPSLTCLSPNLNVNRDPRWGRNVETFGEDPSLISAMGESYIRGIQTGRAGVDDKAAASGYLKIMAVPKHLGAYSVECFNPTGGDNSYPHCPVYRSNFNAVVNATDLRETYFPGWQAAIEQADAQGVMCSYNAINGVPDCVNGELLRGTLNKNWAAKGFVISDAGAVGHSSDVTAHPPGQNYTHGLQGAAVAALINGTTISIESSAAPAYQAHLLPALAKGLVTLPELRAAAKRALLPRFRVGLYDPPKLVPWNSIPASVIESAAHHALARRAAAESFVLLSNRDRTLPLRSVADGGPKTIAVVGLCNDAAKSIGRYSGHPKTSTTVWDGVSAAAAAGGATAVLGVGAGAKALAVAKGTDVAVVVLTGEQEGESHDRQKLGLPPNQLAFLKALIASKVPLVVIMISGGAVDVSLAEQEAAALIAMGCGGMEAGAALADVLFGAVNPSGVLAATVYKASWANASDFLSMAMRTPPGRSHRYLTDKARAEYVLFPFGFGLSFSNWSATLSGGVRPATISVASLTAGANVTITVSVRNHGGPAGSRVSYAMLSRQGAAPSEGWPRQWLPTRGFAKLHDISEHESATAELTITARDLSRWDESLHRFTVRAGQYEVKLRDGAAAAMLTVKTDDLSAPKRNVLHMVFYDFRPDLGEYNMWEKRTVWEAGTRVPAMVHVPPQSRGKRSGAPIELIDIYPTLIDVMGVPSPDATNTWPLEGVSLRPILEDPMLPTLPTLPTRKLARSTYARCPKVGGPLYDDVCIHVVERSAFGNMGYTIRTTRWRFTAWMHWDVAKLAPLSIVPFAVELYDHENDVPGSGKWERVDDFEDKSVHASAPPALLANLTNTLVAAFGLQTPSKKRLSLKTTDWRMLDAATPYPNHYVTRKLTAAESASMVVDGKLDESAWQNAAFTYDIVDITRHKNQQLNAIPNDLQMRVKIRWDDNYFYVGAILHESYVTAQNVGHNNAPPYKPDNDFEIFIDPSGTTQYYMEYEMSSQNATYDIKWGKPDGTQGLACDEQGGSWPALPTCVNTSFTGYGGNWTMATKLHPGPMSDRLRNCTTDPHDCTKPALMNGSLTIASRGGTAWPVAAEDTGMATATAWAPSAYGRPKFPYSQWSAEVRFPIRQTPNYWTEGGGYPTSHGGLIDSDPVRQPIWNQYDPALGDAGPGRPRYWWVNFARAEHPRNYSYADGTSDICPKNCTAKIETAVTVTENVACPPVPRGCGWPTILGGYWEWVWGPVGDADPGVGYMHRPSAFPLVQFANESGEALCRNIEWPGRHVAKSLHLAQLKYWTLSYTNPALQNGSYAADIGTLLNSTLCNLNLHTSDTCDLNALQYASAHPEVFKLGMDMKKNWTDGKITRACPTQPCYMASVQVTVPAGYGAAHGAQEQAAAYVYTCTINSNRDTVVQHATPAATAPCL